MNPPEPIDAQAAELTRLAIAKYALPEEVADQLREARRGFFLVEHRLVERHCRGLRDVLVIGCGAGREAFAFAKEGFLVQAVDLNGTLLQAARDVAPLSGLTFSRQNAVHLAFRDGQFDVVTLLTQMICMIPGRASRVAALREACRVLKPGGVVLVSSLNRKSRWQYAAYFAIANPYRKLRRTLGLATLEPHDYLGPGGTNVRTRQRYFRHIYSMTELLEDLKSAGFAAASCRSRAELNNDMEQEATREHDYLLYYVAQKPRH